MASSLAVPDHITESNKDRVVLFSCHDVDRAMKEEGKRFSPLLEGIRSITDELGYSAMNLTHPYAVFCSKEVKGDTITINYRALLARILSLFCVIGSKSAFRLHLEVQIYSKLLRKLKPEIVFSIQPPSALCIATKKQGIVLIETMHGTNISLSDKIFLAHMEQPESVLPDTIISFDDVSQNTLEVLCKDRNIEAVRSCDPWLHLLRRKQLSEAKENVIQLNSDKNILVTLQWGYDGERDSLSSIIPNGILHPALEDALVTPPKQGVRYLLRMHPIQLNGVGYKHHRCYIEDLCKRHAHLEFEKASSDALPKLMDESCGHITMSSSSVGEASVAEVPTLLLCPTLQPGGANYGLFREPELSGQVVFGKLNTAEILKWIDQCRPKSKTTIDSEQIKKTHAEVKNFYSKLMNMKKTPYDKVDAFGVNK